MKKIIAGILIICIMGIGIPISAVASTDQSAGIGTLYAQAAVLLDADSGRVLYGKEADRVMAMASTTKIMTCIVVLENTKTDAVATVSQEAARQPKVHLGVREGEEYYVGDLLYSLMLESHNDSAVILAEHVGGSVMGFADLMNAKAKEIGCENTYFITPNGLDAQDEKGVHSTTATDLARIMRYCIKESPAKEAFLTVTGTTSHVFSNVSGSRSFSCVNHNAFLGMMAGALTGKTGFTNNAGYCYVGALERDGKTFIVALLACGWPNNKSYKWSDTRKLMEYGLANYEYRNVWKEPKLDAIQVEGGIPDSGRLTDPAYAAIGLKDVGDRTIRLLLHPNEEVEVTVETEELLNAPVVAGTVVGKVHYTLAGEEIRCFEITTDVDVGRISYSWCARKIMYQFLSL